MWFSEYKLAFKAFKNRCLLIPIIKYFCPYLATILKPNVLNITVAEVFL